MCDTLGFNREVPSGEEVSLINYEISARVSPKTCHNKRLPWDFIDYGIKKSYLKEEYHLALESIESPPCNVGNCTKCGVCD